MFKLIAGLGNPGEQYKNTRHNVGFRVIDELNDRLSPISCTSKFDVEICELQFPPQVWGGTKGEVVENQKIFLVKNKTYMNEVGKPIGELARYYKVEPAQTLVIFDDVDLPVGHLRLSLGGSAAGHNGVKSVMENFGQNFYRLRVGIGDNRSAGLPSEAYVLQKFKPEEAEIMKKTIKKAADIVELLIETKNIEIVRQDIAEYNKSVF